MGIDAIGSVTMAMQALQMSQPASSIADAAESPDTAEPDAPAASEFTTEYSMGILADVLHAGADQALTLLQMVQPQSPLR